jgi:hypothetical protein
MVRALLQITLWFLPGILVCRGFDTPVISTILWFSIDAQALATPILVRVGALMQDDPICGNSSKAERNLEQHVSGHASSYQNAGD